MRRKIKKIELTGRAKWIIGKIREGHTFVEYSYSGLEASLQPPQGESIDLFTDEDWEARDLIHKLGMIKHDGRCHHKTQIFELTELGKTIDID